jgi:tetratricopeptide (TPR) repeat protein
MLPQAEEQLLQKELVWERQENTNDLYAWWTEGIQLYKDLLRHDEQNERYRLQLTNLLLKAGGDLKMRQANFNKAQRLFRELVQQVPNHALAYYRLGFLAYYEQKWKSAILNFEKALAAKPSHPAHQLQEEQRIKALGYQARAHQKISLSLLEKAKQMGETILDPEVADSMDAFLLQTERELFAFEEIKPYVLVTRQEVHQLNQDEVIEFQGEQGINEIRLDMLGDKCVLVHPNGERIELSEQLARLLRYLMEQNRPVSSHSIREDVFPDSRSESIVRRTISRLRDTLQYPRHTRFLDELIQTTPDGYLFQWEGDFQIFYRKEDLFLTDILNN